MLPLAAVKCAADYACITLSVVADAPKVVVRSIGKKDVGAQIDRLRRALEAPAEAAATRNIEVFQQRNAFRFLRCALY